MSLQRFTTEFFESEITVLIIDTVGCFHQDLKPFFEEQNILTIVRTVEELSDLPQISIEAQHAYKVLVCVSPSFWTKETEAVLETVSLYQEKLSVVMPVISAWQLQMPGEIPYSTEVFEAQNQAILYCNELLPQANFVFGQDVVLPPGKMSFLDFLCQHIQVGSVFSPTTTVTPQTLAGFCKAATIDVLRPQRISTLVCGRTRPVSAIIQRVVQSFEGYYFSPISVQLVTAQELPTIPFSVANTTVQENIEEVVSWYTRQLPSPENKKFFVPDVVSFAGMGTPAEIQEIPLFIQTSSPSIQENITIISQESQYSESPLAEDSYSYLETTISEQESSKIDQYISSEPFTPSSSPVWSSSVATPQSSLQPDPYNDSDQNLEAKMLHEDKDFNVSSEIQRIFSQSRTESKVERVTTLVKSEKKIKKKSKKKTALFYGGLAFTGMGLGALLLMVIFLTSVHFLKKSLIAVITTASSGETVSEGDFNKLNRFKRVVSAQTVGYGSVFSLPQLEEAEHMVAASEKVKATAEHLVSSQQASKSLALSALGKDSGDVDQAAEKMVLETLAAYENLSQIQIDLAGISFVDSSKIDAITTQFETQLNTIKKRLSIQQQFQPVLANILGKQGKRTYVVLLQNNQELRPTGGFIDAVALVTFENGSLVSKTVYSSYEMDDLSPGDFVPPPEIVKFTGEKRYTFYDMNWDADFIKSADTITKFIEKSLNITVNGVITLDLYGVQNVLEATGPMDFPEYNEVITHKNLFERMEFHSEVVLVPSEKNQDYRKVFLNKLLDKTSALEEDKVLPLLSSLQKSFGEQSMLANFPQEEEQQVFQTLGWTGSLLVPRCPTEFTSLPCQLDPFMQVEANVGVNKANYYLKRSIDHSITISSLEALHTRVITFENTAQSNAWPKGPYKNYTRFYLPAGAQKTGIAIDGVSIPDSEVIRSEEKGQTVLGVYFEVPMKETKQLSVQFSVPFSALAAQSDFSYVFFNHEQPGNGASPFVLRIKPTIGLIPKLIAPQATIDSSGIMFAKANDETGLYGVQFDQAN